MTTFKAPNVAHNATKTKSNTIYQKENLKRLETIKTMKEKLYELQGFIEQYAKDEHDWYANKMLQEKLQAIEILLTPMPFGLGNIIEQFEREIK